MGDTFNIQNSQIGAVGSGAEAKNNTFIQKSDSQNSSLDFDLLLKELEHLKTALKEKLEEPDNTDHAQIILVEKSAKQKDESLSIQHLKRISKIGLQMANQIGCGLITEIMKKNLL